MYVYPIRTSRERIRALFTEMLTRANALADRPELRGLRAVYEQLSPDTLPVAREQLRAGNPLLGASPPPPRP